MTCSCASRPPNRLSWLCPRSRFCDRLPVRTQRALIRFVGRQRNGGERVKRNVDALFTAAAIDDGGGADDARPGGARDVDGLLRRSSGCHDIFDDENLFTWHDRKAPSKRQLAVLPLGKNRPNAERTANLLTDHDSTKRGGQHDVGRERTDAFRNRRTTRFGFGGMLQHKRALQVTRTMKSGRQPEVSLEQRADPSKPIEHGSRCGHVSRSHNVIIRSYICHWWPQ
jgi:hypothetical protein